MERIANPVTGRTDADSTLPETDVPLHRLLSRYAFVLLFPVLLLLGPATADAPPWLMPGLMVLAVTVLGRGAHGSWLTPAPFGAWQVACLAEGGVMLIAFMWSVLGGEPLIITGAAILMIGAVLGVGVSQLWRWRNARR